MGKRILESNVKWEDVPSFVKVSSKILIGKEDPKSFAFIIQRVDVGGKVPEHSHQEESCYYFTKGCGKLHLGKEIFEIEPGLMVHILPWENHGIDNVGNAPIFYIEVKIFNTSTPEKG